MQSIFRSVPTYRTEIRQWFAPLNSATSGARTHLAQRAVGRRVGVESANHPQLRAIGVHVAQRGVANQFERVEVARKDAVERLELVLVQKPGIDGANVTCEWIDARPGLRDEKNFDVQQYL